MGDLIVKDRISRAATAAEQLCAVLWETLHAEAEAGRASSVAALSERLSEITRSVGVLAATATGAASMPGEGGGNGAREAGGSGSATGTAETWRGSFEGRVAAPQPAEGWRSESGGLSDGPMPHADERPGGHPSASLVDEQRRVDAGAIEVRDVRRSEGSSWRAAVQRRLERFTEDWTPFSVLLVETVDVVRLQLAQPPEEAQQITDRIEAAISGVLRPADTLIREAMGRYWLIAPDTGSALARSLAEQLAAAAGGSASHRGAAIRVTVGIAVCPEHGRDADSLIAHADMDLYAAQAAGRSVGGFDGDSRPR